MKALVAVFALTGLVSTAHALPLTPVSSTTRDCVTKATDAVYSIPAACWKNRDNQLRAYFKEDTMAVLKESNINTKHLKGVEAACASAPLYAYEDLFGPTAKAPEEIVTTDLQLGYTHLDSSACFLP